MAAMQDWLVQAARVRARRGIIRHAEAAAGPAGPLLDLASNDYLGLATDPRLKAAAVDAIYRFGTGARASRVVTGTLAIHAQLEDELCALTGQPAALVFSSGYTANLGVLTALGRPGTLILTDQHVHASVIDAARLSRCDVEVFRHGDLAALRRALENRTVPRAVVVVESIYSVFGDAADLPATAALCADHDAILVVDEAHGVSVLGGGRGGVHAAGLAGADHVIVTATLSKALGAQGGAVLGSPMLREHLVNTARTFIFDTGLAPSSAAAAAEACRIVAAEPDRVAAIARNAALIADECGMPAAAGAVQSLPVSTPEAAVAITQTLRDAGVLVGCFRPPSVPDGISRLRMTASAALDPDQAVRAAKLITSIVADQACATT
jgi:8-amino-7-oxononanoate synthase